MEREGEYNGFSGSPILEIMPFYNSNYEIVMEAIPIGIMLSATKHHCEFITQ